MGTSLPLKPHTLKTVRVAVPISVYKQKKSLCICLPATLPLDPHNPFRLCLCHKPHIIFLFTNKTSNTWHKILLKSALKMHLRRLKIQKFSCPVEGNTLSIRSPSPGDFFPYFHINKKTLCIYYQTNAKKYF